MTSTKGNIEEVHFYPGSHEMIYLVNGEPKVLAEAWGGPPHAIPPAKGEKMAREPTSAGEFVIAGTEAYRTDTWGTSKIPWGTPIRRSKTDARKIEFRTESGKWKPLSMMITRTIYDDNNQPRDETVPLTVGILMSWYMDNYRSSLFPSTWLLNDFGPIAVRYFQDRNKNRRLDAGEKLEGRMIHTTPENEATTFLNEKNPLAPRPIDLDPSHGCIHIRPIDLRSFLKNGAFRYGMPLIIHYYDESYSGSLRR